MNQTVSIGIIGDFDPNRSAHPATNDALHHAANHLSVRVNITWLPTPSILTKRGQKNLEKLDAIWASAGSPYQSMEGALRGIQLAREMNRPFIGT
jgi:CTP synthase (UTP-ammonia lyase)